MHSGTSFSLPLYRAGRLGADVVDDAVDTLDLVDDAARDLLEDLVGKPHPVGRHAVGACDGPHGDYVLVGPPVAHDANRLDGKQHRLSLIHISEPTRRTPISYAVFCL